MGTSFEFTEVVKHFVNEGTAVGAKSLMAESNNSRISIAID